MALLGDHLRLQLGLRLGRPATSWVWIRRPARSSRHCSTGRSRRSSLVMDWPSMLPTGARWSL